MVQPRVLDLNPLIEEMERILRRLIGENIEIAVTPTPDLWKVKIDPIQLEQVLVNLAINARDAMPEGGRLLIATANLRLDGTNAFDHPPGEVGDYVQMTVRDTGCGMSEEIQAHIFEPYFTTKEVGKGTGLGLATCYGIVRQAGGYIGVESAPGQGTAFTVYLPRVSDEPKTDTPSVSDATRERGDETILLVEDEAMVRDTAVEGLRVRGYHVLVAECGEEALALAECHAEPIHLLLTDVVMPKMTGEQVAQSVREIRPEIKVLYVSGYTEIAQNGLNMRNTGFQFLAKPFTATELARKVRETLDAPELG